MNGSVCVGCTRESRRPVRSARDGLYLCQSCRRDRQQHPEADVALTGGRWELRGLTKVWVAS